MTRKSALSDGRRVLLVDDNELVRDTAATQLEELGYHVMSVDSAAEAIACLESSESFHILLTDIIMPGGMNGAELVHYATRRWPALKVLATSGYAGTPVLGQIELPPGVKLLPKPHTMAELADALARLFDEVVNR